MKKITKELPSLRKSVRIIGDLISDEKYDLPLAVMNELLDYKDTLEDFDLAISELKEDLIDSGAYNEDYIEKTIQEILDDNKPCLELIINSGGGDVTEGFAIIDIIKELQDVYGVQVNTHAIGSCASMAVALYMTGDIRTAGDNVVFMLHQIKGGAVGSQNKIESTIQCMNILNKQYKRMFKGTRITEQELDEILTHDKDHYFDIDEARKWGIVNDDDIIDSLVEVLTEAAGNEDSETEEETVDIKEVDAE